MSSCIFCSITKREVPAESILFEDDAVMAFPDIHPKAPIHILIVPKKHITSVLDLKEDETPLVARMIQAAKRVAEAQGLKGYKLIVNVGRDGGQVIDHLHMHLLGGWQKDADRSVKGV